VRRGRHRRRRAGTRSAGTAAEHQCPAWRAVRGRSRRRCG
jgi:hypothetical protein